MPAAYLVGHIAIKDAGKWIAYRDQVPDTLKPWNAEITFRGKRAATFSGTLPYNDIVVIRFPDQHAIDNWHASPAYQALIPLREQAADVLLLSYET